MELADQEKEALQIEIIRAIGTGIGIGSEKTGAEGGIGARGKRAGRRARVGALGTGRGAGGTRAGGGGAGEFEGLAGVGGKRTSRKEDQEQEEKGSSYA